MIEHTYKELYNQDSVDKQFVIAYEDGEITNEDLYSESFELTESLCSQNELRFGSCEASMLKFKIANVVETLKDKWLTVSQVLVGKDDTPFQFGKYKVYSDIPSGDRNYRNITAYDSMYDIINADVAVWYESLVFPITLKEFRDSFFEYFGIEQVETELILDNLSIDKTISATSISGKDIITAICELNGVFGHINRQGNFVYVSLADKTDEILYPKIDLYPSNVLYSATTPYNPNYHSEILNGSKYISCEYEDFNTSFITKLQIRQEENDIGAVVGDGTNTYIIEDNFLVYGKTAEVLEEIAGKIFAKIKTVQYRPFKAVLRGNPCLEVGDAVVFHTRYKDVEGYILERTLKGIQSLKDTFRSEGVYKYAEKVNSVQKEVRRLKGKTNVLERTVEMLNSEISDEEKGLKSQIKQAAEAVATKVSKGEVVSEINQSAEEVKIKGNKISLEGTVTANENFKVLEDGSIQTKNGTFEGTIKSQNAEITGGYVNIETDSDEYSVITVQGYGARTETSPNGVIVETDSYRASHSFHAISLVYLGDITFYASRTRVDISGNLHVSGTKSRLAKTKSYNERILYCYEMPTPIFGDVGHGVIGEDGLCYVDIDQIFFETVDTNQSYQVFLQSYSEHNVYVMDKHPQYFVVKGEPNIEFDWELKAKQLDFPTERLDENFARDDYEETDYVASANAYLTQYEQEVLSYE